MLDRDSGSVQAARPIHHPAMERQGALFLSTARRLDRICKMRFLTRV